MLGDVAERSFLLVQPLNVGNIEFEHFLYVKLQGIVRGCSRRGRIFITVAVELNVGGLHPMARTVRSRKYVAVRVVVMWSMVMMVRIGRTIFVMILSHDRTKKTGHVVDDALRIK